MKSWTVKSEDGIEHIIEYKKGLFKNNVIVDGEPYKLKSSNWFVYLVDYSITFGNTECRLVAMGNKVDLAVNGTFLDSKEPYAPLSGIPSWIYVLIAISCGAGLFLGGVILLCIGLIFSTLYLQFGLKKKTGPVIGSFVACTAIQIVLLFTIGTLFNLTH